MSTLGESQIDLKLGNVKLVMLPQGYSGESCSWRKLGRTLERLLFRTLAIDTIMNKPIRGRNCGTVEDQKRKPLT
jgi:hypothetical protein